MWDFIKQNPFVTGALSGSLAAYLLGLFVTYLRREKKWLGYSVESRIVALKGHTKLKMKFEDRDIERLDSHTVVLRNIGNKALTKQIITIELAGGGEIVEVKLKGPTGGAIAEDRQKSSLTLTPDLLNPTEQVEVELTSADTPHGDVNVLARGEYLQVRSLSSIDIDPELVVGALKAVPFTGNLMAAMYRLVISIGKAGLARD